MPTERCRVTDTFANWENWGKLVKTWATGKNYFNDNNNFALPATMTMPIGDFTAMLANAHVDMSIPAHISKVQFIQGDDDTLVIRIPPKEMVLDSETRLQGLIDAQHPVAKYPLPIFYVQAWNPGAEQLSLNAERMMTMHSQRIGEYTINLCA